MAKHVFKFLLRLIGYVCKEAESRYVYKGILIERADVAGKKLPLHHGPCRLKHVFGQAEAVCKVICTACGDVAHRNDFSAPQDSGHHLIQCAVSSACDHTVVSFRLFLGRTYRIARILSRIDRNFVSAFHQNINHIAQMVPDLSLTSLRIVDKKHFLLRHERAPPFHL